jgi:hypothetical protein
MILLTIELCIESIWLFCNYVENLLFLSFAFYVSKSATYVPSPETHVSNPETYVSKPEI